MQVRAIVRAAKAVGTRTGAAPQVEIMHPLVAFAEELARLRDSHRAHGRRRRRDGLRLRNHDRAAARVRARLRTSPSTPTSSRSGRATSLRRHSDSHATTPKANSSTIDLDEANPRARSVPDARSGRAWGDLMRIAVERGRSTRPRNPARNLRRARRRPGNSSSSATGSGSTTSPARPIGSRSRGWLRHRPRSRRLRSAITSKRAAKPVAGTMTSRPPPAST